MKNTKSSVKKEAQTEEQVDLDLQDDDIFPQYGDPNTPPVEKTNPVMIDPFDTTLLGCGIPNYALDPKSFRNQKFPPLATPDQLEAVEKLYTENPSLEFGNVKSVFDGKGINDGFDSNADWIQTYSGRRFNPLNPYPDAIVIQDIAHSLSMLCRFTGHCKKFYSVAQHSVLVSYICDSKDAMWGLLHDASEAYLTDIPRPLKRSGKFEMYREFEAKMQKAICTRFDLPEEEPPSVKKADTLLLATEARDLMSPLHPDWRNMVEPLPFKIEPWEHEKAKDMFMKRFFELFSPAGATSGGYEHYLMYKDQL